MRPRIRGQHGGEPRRPRAPREGDTSVYTVEEAAYVLSLSLSTTYALLRRGEIPARRVGRRWLISRERLHAWLNDPPVPRRDGESESASSAGTGSVVGIPVPRRSDDEVSPSAVEVFGTGWF